MLCRRFQRGLSASERRSVEALRAAAERYQWTSIPHGKRAVEMADNSRLSHPPRLAEKAETRALLPPALIELLSSEGYIYSFGEGQGAWAAADCSWKELAEMHFHALRHAFSMPSQVGDPETLVQLICQRLIELSFAARVSELEGSLQRRLGDRRPELEPLTRSSGFYPSLFNQPKQQQEHASAELEQ